MKIGIIFGHGQGDSGATAFGKQEALEVRSLESELRNHAKKLGVPIAIYDTNLNAFWQKNAGTWAVNNRCTYVCEIHLNAGGGTGTELLILPKLHADDNDIKVLDAMTSTFKLANRGIKHMQLQNLSLIASRGISCSLLECVFIDNQNDMVVWQAKKSEFARKLIENLSGKKGDDDEMKIVDLKQLGLIANGNERGYFGEFDRRLYIQPTRKKINDWNIALTIPKGAEVDISCIAFDEEGHYLAPCKYVANGRQHMGFVVVNTNAEKKTDFKETQSRTTTNGLNATNVDCSIQDKEIARLNRNITNAKLQLDSK